MTRHADRDHSEQPAGIVFATRLAEQGHRIDPLAALHDAMVFSSADWGAARDLAFIYGIVVGWDGDPDDEPDEDDGDAMSELAAKFGWSEQGVQRLRAMHAVYGKLRPASQRLADAGTPQSAPEPSQAATEAHSDENWGWCYSCGDLAKGDDVAPIVYRLRDEVSSLQADLATAEAKVARVEAGIDATRGMLARAAMTDASRATITSLLDGLRTALDDPA
jgi:hypothetical protein